VTALCSTIQWAITRIPEHTLQSCNSFLLFWASTILPFKILVGFNLEWSAGGLYVRGLRSGIRDICSLKLVLFPVLTTPFNMGVRCVQHILTRYPWSCQAARLVGGDGVLTQYMAWTYDGNDENNGSIDGLDSLNVDVNASSDRATLLQIR
jgi:hypothetical protein